MDANEHPEHDLIIAAALEILAGGPLTFDVVIDGLYERGLLSHLAGLDEEALFDEIDEIFSMTDALWDSGNLVASTAQLLDGITFTHLVSADELDRGTFELPTPEGSIREIREFLAGIECRTYFTCNHASNYLPLTGRLPAAKEDLLSLLDAALAGDLPLKPESLRGL